MTTAEEEDLVSFQLCCVVGAVEVVTAELMVNIPANANVQDRVE